MAVDTRTIEKMMVLFKGNMRAHGVYIEAANQDPLKKKVKGKCMTVPLAPTLKKWETHFEGTQGIGIIPIDEDNSCYWGALDIDGEVDHVHILTRINELSLPLVVCKSKSGSAHCYLFLENPVPASTIRSILEEMASKIGASGCEIFPKQDTLNIDKGDMGNWLNMPYFKGTERQGVLLDDNQELILLSVVDFIDYAYSKRLTADDWQELIKHIKQNIDDLETVLQGAPPCIQYILKTQGFREGTRNKLLFNIAVYCKMRYNENEYPDKVKEIHDRFAEDALSIRELNTVIDSVKDKDYRYQCKDSMLKQFCNPSICVDRDNGIDFSTEIKGIKSATRILTTPNIYAVEVELEAERPTKVYVTVDQLFRQDLFRKECSEQLHKTFAPISPKLWGTMSTNIVNTAINQEPPFDMQEGGQMYMGLMEYLPNRGQEDPSCLAHDDGVYVDYNNEKIYFKLAGLRAFLMRRGIIDKSLTPWALGQKLSNIIVPTDEIDMDMGEVKKRKVSVGSSTLHANGKSYYVRFVTISEMNLAEALKNAMEGIV